MALVIAINAAAMLVIPIPGNAIETCVVPTIKPPKLAALLPVTTNTTVGLKLPTLLTATTLDGKFVIDFESVPTWELVCPPNIGGATIESNAKLPACDDACKPPKEIVVVDTADNAPTELTRLTPPKVKMVVMLIVVCPTADVDWVPATLRMLGN